MKAGKDALTADERRELRMKGDSLTAIARVMGMSKYTVEELLALGGEVDAPTVNKARAKLAALREARP